MSYELGKPALQKQGRTATYWKGVPAGVKPPPQVVPNWNVTAKKVAAGKLLFSSNPNVRTFAATKPGWTPRKPVSVTNYYNAGVQAAYGNLNAAHAELGDLFNDIMGAVVPGWDMRPDWMKKIVVKPDPTKILQTAQQIAPQAGSQVVGAMEKAGLNVFVNTPAGQMPVTPGNAQTMWSNLPMIASAQQTLANIPNTVWIIGGVGVLALLFMAKK